MLSPEPTPVISPAATRGPAAVYEFCDFRLDCGRFELLHKGRPLRVKRKPMDLLILLVSRKGPLVPRTEIAQRLWSSEVFVDTEHGINTAIRKLRHLLHDDSDDPHFIQTVTGMGYGFVAPVSTIAPDHAGRGATRTARLFAHAASKFPGLGHRSSRLRDCWPWAATPFTGCISDPGRLPIRNSPISPTLP